MKEKIKSTLRHPLISGSAVIFLGTNIGNVFNFLFNLFMVRNLTPVDYGVLVGLIAIITLLAQMADSITPFVVNYAAIYFAVGELGKAKTLFFKILKLSIAIGIVVLLVFVVFASPIGSFLKIQNPTNIMIAGLCIFFGFLSTLNRAFLQAKLAFIYLAIIVFVASFIKFLSGVFFIGQGLGVQGALFAFILAFFIPYLISFIPLKQLLHRSQLKEKIELRKMMKFGIGSVISVFAVTAFVTTDILLVKHFFSPSLAGLYAGMTIVGKIVYFFSAPIGSVMFPLIVQKYAKKQNYHTDFRLALVLIGLPSILLTSVYFLLPDLVIQFVMKRDEYLTAAPYIGFVGIFFTFYSLITVMVNFFLSIQKTYIFLPVLVFALLQGVGIWFLHDSLMQVLTVSMLASGLLLLTLLLYYFKLSFSKR